MATRPFYVRLKLWARRVGLSAKLAIGLTLAAIIAGAATYSAFSNSDVTTNIKLVRTLLLVDLVLLLSLAALIARRLAALWAARRSGLAGSRLHGRLVAMFSIIAIVPPIILAVFSALFFELGLETWFSDRVRTALDNALQVAEAYAEEHKKTIEADILAMASDLNQQAPVLSENVKMLAREVSAQAALRSLSEAIVFDGEGRTFAHANLSVGLGIDRLPKSAIERANAGAVVILTSKNADQVRALIRLDRYFDTYLYVSRFVDPLVLGHVARTRESISEYRQLEAERSRYQTTFNIIFIVLALLVLLSAVWTGLWLANRLVAPISRMVTAVGRVREGDLSARVPEGPVVDEIDILSRAFNRMTAQLESQRHDLVNANEQLDERRRFTETVLAGVTAGVIGLDAGGVITLPNRSAQVMLGMNAEKVIGQPLATQVPEMAALLEEALHRPDKLAQSHLSITREGRMRNLLVRVSAEFVEGKIRGYVVTFDDITKLVAAQRTAAWADVARRIAHEIKNPLTPIQLSAERLKRKYGREIHSDPTVFSQCTDTIVRHVGDIRHMVDEFSAFARMPAPVFKPEDLGTLVREAVFLQEVAHPDIHFVIEAPETPVCLSCDGRQISQALTNVLKNAVESIAGRSAPATGKLPPGVVRVTIEIAGHEIWVRVCDNGQGLPEEQRDRLTEPYVTTRVKGTGLGLAIVHKIMEDHGGELVLEQRDEGGACVSLGFVGEAPAARTGGRRQQEQTSKTVASHGE